MPLLSTIGTYSVVRNGVTFYPLTNTATDPTSSTWRVNNPDYVFLPNTGIYTKSPMTNASFMFTGNTTFNDPDITLWNTFSITNMQGMFQGATAFNQPIGVWNVVNVTSFIFLFQNATSFNKDLSGWNTASATNMGGMLQGATAFNSGQLAGVYHTLMERNTVTNKWVTSRVIDMTSMFQNASSWNGNIHNWCVTNIATLPTNFATNATLWSSGGYPLWGRCDPIGTFFPLRNTATDPTNQAWRTANPGYTFIPNVGIRTSVVMTSAASMFQNALTFNDSDIAFWDTSSFTSISSMFNNARAFNQPIGNWDVSNVVNMRFLFSSTVAFNQPLNGWNVSNVTNSTQAFSGASAFNQPIGNWDTSKNTNMSYMFEFAISFNQDIGNWNTGRLVNAYGMFSGASSFNCGQAPGVLHNLMLRDGNSWNTGLVTAGNMDYMFQNAPAFNGLLINWCVSNIVTLPTGFATGATAWASTGYPIWGRCDPEGAFFLLRNTATDPTSEIWRTNNPGYTFTPNVGIRTVGLMTNASSMLFANDTFNDPDVLLWNTSNITSMQDMFAGCLAFNQDISAWNTAAVTNMSGMFSSCSAFNQPIGSWNTAAVTNMSNMFSSALAFNQNISNWNVSNVNNMSRMFFFASSFNCGQTAGVKHTLLQRKTVGGWNTALASNMTSMFQGATSWNGNICYWCVPLITTQPGNFATGATSFKTVYYPVWGRCDALGTFFPMRNTSVNPTNASWRTANPGYTFTPNVGITTPTPLTNMGYMVSGSTFNDPDVEVWNVSRVNNTIATFFNCASFNQPIGDWDMSSVLRMSSMFQDAIVFNQPIGNWNTSNCFDMGALFYRAKAFNQQIGSWNTSKVTTFFNTFRTAQAFNQNIDAWNTSSATTMASMFLGATVFNQPIESWNTSNVTDMNNMFFACSAFNQNINNWNTANVTNMSYMFANTRVFNQPIGNWNTSKVTNMSYMFAGPIIPTTAFNQPIGNWDVSNVRDMNSMFLSASFFNQNISTWNISSLNSVESMFLDATFFNCGQPGGVAHELMNRTATGGWRTNRVIRTGFDKMFYLAVSFNGNINKWCVTNQTSTPFSFATNANPNFTTARQPVWGTCPIP